jgi:hypothetical protein
MPHCARGAPLSVRSDGGWGAIMEAHCLGLQGRVWNALHDYGRDRARSSRATLGVFDFLLQTL